LPEPGSTPVQELCVQPLEADWLRVLRALWPILFPQQQHFGASPRCHRVKTPLLLQARHALQIDDQDLSVHHWILTSKSLLSRIFWPTEPSSQLPVVKPE